MATSDLKNEAVKADEPTKQEAFRNNLAPETKPHTPGKAEEARQEAKKDALDHDGNGRKGGAKNPAPEAENPAIERQQYQDKLEEEFRDQVEASRKDSPVDALGLPEGEGDVVWSGAVEISPRDSQTDEDGKPIKETDKQYDKRLNEGEMALVKGATEFLSPLFGSLRPLAYNLVRTDTHLRLEIVNTQANPDAARVGGKPNELGKF